MEAKNRPHTQEERRRRRRRKEDTNGKNEERKKERTMYQKNLDDLKINLQKRMNVGYGWYWFDDTELARFSSFVYEWWVYCLHDCNGARTFTPLPLSLDLIQSSYAYIRTLEAELALLVDTRQNFLAQGTAAVDLCSSPDMAILYLAAIPNGNVRTNDGVLDRAIVSNGDVVENNALVQGCAGTRPAMFPNSTHFHRNLIPKIARIADNAVLLSRFLVVWIMGERPRPCISTAKLVRS